jgi:hypothetical protein
MARLPGIKGAAAALCTALVATRVWMLGLSPHGTEATEPPNGADMRPDVGRNGYPGSH